VPGSGTLAGGSSSTSLKPTVSTNSPSILNTVKNSGKPPAGLLAPLKLKSSVLQRNCAPSPKPVNVDHIGSMVESTLV